MIPSSIEPLKKYMFPYLNDWELTRFGGTSGYLNGKVVSADPEWRRRGYERGLFIHNGRPAFDQYRESFPERFKIECRKLPLLPFQIVKWVVAFEIEQLKKAWRNEPGG